MTISRKNHWARNIITRGNMNISALYKGFVLPAFKFVIRRKHGGSSVQGEGLGHLHKELHKLSGHSYEDVDLIEVYIDWNKEVEKHGKLVYVELMKKRITANLVKSTNKKFDIKVELVKKS